MRESSLVGRDDRLAEPQRAQDHGAGDGRASHQLGNDMHLRSLTTACQSVVSSTSESHRARLVKRLDGDFADTDLHADARRQETAVKLERMEHAAATVPPPIIPRFTCCIFRV